MPPIHCGFEVFNDASSFHCFSPGVDKTHPESMRQATTMLQGSVPVILMLTFVLLLCLAVCVMCAMSRCPWDIHSERVSYKTSPPPNTPQLTIERNPEAGGPTNVVAPISDPNTIYIV